MHTKKSQLDKPDGRNSKTEKRSRHCKKHIKFWYTNASNLYNKIDELEGRLKIDEPDVIGVTEVWMKEEVKIVG